MTNSLVAPADLDGFMGAPFTDAVVDAVAAVVRDEAGWHIAPSVTETVTIDSAGGRYLFLPTLRLTGVTEIRNVTDQDDVVVVDGWRSHETLRFRAGVLDRPSGWPCGVLELDITHGYATCPADLLPAVAAQAREARGGAGGGAVRLGSLSLTLPESADTVGDRVGRYKIRRIR